MIVRWIHESFEVKSRQVAVGEHDRIHEMIVELPQRSDEDTGRGATVSVEAAMLAHWQPECVYDYLFRAPPDAVLLVLTAMATVQHVNAMAMGWARPHLARMPFAPVVIVNDPHGRNANFPTVTDAQVREDHNVPWPIRETMIGNFYGDHLRWKEGAEDAWRCLLNA
ncbi:MAG: hypothetical protein U0270_35270 [Labilithrix sp.]